MSTRATIAVQKKNGWEGVYSHWDGYPSGLGKALWDTAQKDFIHNRGGLGVSNRVTVTEALKAFVFVNIYGHKGGWSSFSNKECYCHSPEFVLRDGPHNRPLEKGKDGEDKDFWKDTWCNYLYIIDPKAQNMKIYSDGKYVATADFKVGAEEPDWKNL